MAEMKSWRRDLLVSMFCSAVIVIGVLLPYLASPDIGLSHRYRGLLIVVSALAAPLIDLLISLPERSFLAAASVVTWAVNSVALFVVLICVRVIRRRMVQARVSGSPS